MYRAASRPARWTSPRAHEDRASQLQLRLHRRGEGWPSRDLVEKGREARPTRAPSPHLVAAGDVFQRGAEHDLRRVDRPLIVALNEGGLERVGGALGPRRFERDDPGRLQAETQFTVAHGHSIEKGI